MKAWFIWFIILIFFIILPARRRKRTAAQIVMKKRKNRLSKEERMKMYELLKRFIGKRCNISVINSSVSTLGTITEVQDNWVIVDTNSNGLDVINIDYITTVSEWPKAKKKNNKEK